MIVFDAALDISDSDARFILKYLPPNWDTVVLNYNAFKNKELHIKINAPTQLDTKNWIHAFEKLTNTSYSIFSSYDRKGKRVFYKKRYHCHHNTRHKETYNSVSRNSIKNTKCPSTLIISIRKILARYQGKYRPADPNKPCEIKVKLQHNHATDTPDILKFRKVLPEVKYQLIELYLNGYTAKNALAELKKTIKQNNPDYKQIFDDRSRCPDYNYCYHLFLKCQNAQNSDEFILTTLFETYNVKCSDFSAEMAFCEDGIVVCGNITLIGCFGYSLCPPITKRVHSLKESNQIVHIDSFASNDKNGSRIFLFLTASEIGCLPLGVLIISKENETMITTGLLLLKEMLGECAFGRNSYGPNIFVTDVFLGQFNILSGIWPNSKTYLSTYHVLQSIWNWLSSSDNNIAIEDRSLLFRDFYNTLYAKTEANFNISYEVAQKSALKYQNFLDLLSKYYNKKDLWARYGRPDVLQTENETTKFSDSTVRFLRSSMFKNYKNFETIPIVRHVLHTYFPYFESRCHDIASSIIPDPFCFKNDVLIEEIEGKIRKVAQNMRLIQSFDSPNTNYLINTDLLTCTCPNANSSAICKHVESVAMVLYQQTFEQNCQYPDVIKKCHYLATGEDFREHADGFDEYVIDNEENFNPEEDPLYISDNFEAIPTEIEESDQNSTVENFAVYEEECLDIARRESVKKECLEIWHNMKTVLQTFIDVSSEDISPILGKIASKFQTFNTVDDLKSAFNVFDPVEPKKVQKRPPIEDDDDDDKPAKLFKK